MTDLTSSSIATKLLPEDATAADRAIVEAMAEAALRIVPEGCSAGATFFAVERAMVGAANAVRKQHGIRCERAMTFLESLKDDDPDNVSDEMLGKAIEP